jgi:hypothetical protein
MADYTEFTAAEVDVNSPLDEDFFTKMKDNFINHEDRLLPLENGFKFEDHFTWRPFPDTRSFEDYARVTLSTTVPHEGKDWILFGDGNARNAAKPDWTAAKLDCAGGSEDACLWAKHEFQPNRIVPTFGTIAITGKIKLVSDAGFVVGFHPDWDFQNAFAALKGVSLVNAGGGNYRFDVRNTGTRTGSAFAKPTLGTYFTFGIEIQTGVQIRCTINGTQTDLFTSLTAAEWDNTLDYHIGVRLSENSGASEMNIDRLGHVFTNSLGPEA